MDNARQVIERTLGPLLLSLMTSCDVASTIHQSLRVGRFGFRAASKKARGSLRTSTRLTLNVLVLLRACV